MEKRLVDKPDMTGTVEVNLTRAKAIRLKCLECSGGQPPEIRKCHLEGCPLWIYRMGNVNRAKELMAEKED